MKNVLFVILILSMATTSFGVKLNLLYAWKYVDFLWESPQQKQEAIDSGNYNASSVLLEDLDEAPDGRIFLTAWKSKGVPASLMTVSNEKGEGGSLLRPYPNWSWHTNKNCEGVTGANRIYIKCNHMFVMDCGQIGFHQVCPPQVLIFDLATDKLVKRINIPSSVAKNGTYGFLKTIIPVVPNCRNIKDNAIIFITDTSRSGLVVYNPHTSKFCRIETEFMKPTNTNFTLENVTFYLADGIMHLAISDKDLYYAAFSSNELYKIEISKLIDCSLSNSKANELTQLVSTLSNQPGPIAFEECALFFSNVPETTIMCADAAKKIDFNNMEVIVQNPKELQCMTAMKIIDQSHSKSIQVLSTRCQHFLVTGYNLRETNFRIHSINITEIRKTHSNCFASCN